MRVHNSNRSFHVVVFFLLSSTSHRSSLCTLLRSVCTNRLLFFTVYVSILLLLEMYSTSIGTARKSQTHVYSQPNSTTSAAGTKVTTTRRKEVTTRQSITPPPPPLFLYKPMQVLEAKALHRVITLMELRSQLLRDRAAQLARREQQFLHPSLYHSMHHQRILTPSSQNDISWHHTDDMWF